MVRKVKGLNVKALALKHGEKIVLPAVGAMVLFVLAGTKWMPYGGHPREITNAVQEAQDKLATKTWPKQERRKFMVSETESVHYLVNNIHQQVNPAPYQFTEKFRFNIHETSSPITEPKYFTVSSLIADADRMVIYVRPQQNMDWYAAHTLGEEDTIGETKLSQDNEVPDAFKTSDWGVRPGAYSSYVGLLGEGERDRGRSTRTGRGNARGMAGLGKGTLDEFEDELLGIGFASSSGSWDVEGRGLRYVAIRGAFPLRDQLKEIKKAANVNSLWEAEQLFHIIDFELQRKKMLTDAEDPWRTEWETVDVEVSKEVLQEAADFAPEPHESMVTDAGFTMPLPQRAMGIYGNHATHPALENWELSEEEMAFEMEIQEKLLKEHLEMRANQPVEIVRKRGFADLVHDPRSLMGSLRPGRSIAATRSRGEGRNVAAMPAKARGVGGSGGGFGAFTGGYGIGGAFQQMQDPDSFFKKLEKASDSKERSQLLREHIQRQINVEGEMLLFRYLDFDVEPGATYRYRVRVVVTNPNYGRKSSEAAGLESVVKGQTRTTEWSNVTEPVRVPDDVDYFVQSVKTKGGDPTRVEVNFTLFQWDPEAGTTVTNRDLEVEPGEEIGGYGFPYVLDPAKSRFEMEKYEFQTGDLIVDAAYVDAIDPKRHPDLQLPRLARRDPGVSDQVLVVHKSGAMSIVDEKSRSEALALRHQYLNHEQSNYGHIKGAKAKLSQDPIGRGLQEFVGLRRGISGYDDEALGAAGRGRNEDQRQNRRGSNTLRKVVGGGWR